ncbi:MAG: DUF2214 family protein, partial [Burkholderiaceae bacterium]
MATSALFAFLHHLAAFTLVSAIVVEWLLMRNELTAQNARQLARADAFLGASATAILVIGALRVMYFEKGPSFYMHNEAFFAKMALFLVVALLSIYPTIQFMKWSRAVKAGQPIAPDAGQLALVRRLLHFELIGIVLILLCAALM